MSIDFAEHRPGGDRGRREPGVEGIDGPELFAVRHRQVGALAFLVVLGMTEVDKHAAGAPLDVIEL